MASRLTVEAPEFAPAVGGLLPVANVIETADPHFAQGVTYMADPHGPAKAAPNFCYSAIPVAETEKDFESPDVYDAGGFAVYRGFECGLSDWDSYDARAATLLGRGESSGVESGVRQLILDGPDKVVVATGVTDIVDAVARLEEFAGDMYGGLPTMHVGRYGATHIARRGLADSDNGLLTTKQGTPIANGSGYGRGAGASVAGKSYWVWMTGQVNLWRGPVKTARGTDLAFNRAVGLAERIYVPAVEGFVAGILVEEETP